ncbi:MAG: type IX secretion system membrane protein PorP/SprF, partial [Flavobacteriaceae bacterium]|nr:type IX secretion system membrane protein PorP/SprF [Flavobacteriaceae bacterium]
FKPATLLKYVSDAPLNIDITANFMYDHFITMGLAYRWDAALSALLAVQLNPQLKVGFGYDREVTSLGDTSFNSGSFEFFLQYQLVFKTTGVLNPRFF